MRPITYAIYNKQVWLRILPQTDIGQLYFMGSVRLISKIFHISLRLAAPPIDDAPTVRVWRDSGMFGDK